MRAVTHGRVILESVRARPAPRCVNFGNPKLTRGSDRRGLVCRSMEHSVQELLSLPEEIEVRAKQRDHSVAWLIVFTSAALTLASATGRRKASPPLPLPASSGTVQPAGPKCGPSCPKERTPAASDRRRPSFLA